MTDVAARAAVSAKTVSRVVNGDPHVSPDTVERVTAAIRALGFRRNDSARQLRQGTTATIGVLIEDIADPFYGAVTRAIEEDVLARDHLLLVSSSAEDAVRADRLVRSFVSRGVDGLVVAPATGQDVGPLVFEVENGCPIVLIDRPVDGLDVDTVLVDNRRGTLSAAAHLIAQGHRRIAYFGDDASVFTAVERRDGYLEALAREGIPQDDALIVSARPTEEGARAAVAAIAALADPPTAIVSGNNRWSVQLLRTGMPGERGVAFVGFDDFELAEVLSPGITVVAQDPAAMGRLACELLFRRIAGDRGPVQRIELATRLVPRGSGEIQGPFARS